MKCQWCEKDVPKAESKFTEKPSGKLNKNGTEGYTRKYYHSDCFDKFNAYEKNKVVDLKELDELYQYLLKLHNVKSLDGRMMEKIQDLRNGTIKVNNKKIVKFKSGVPYVAMLNTYKFVDKNIDYAISTMQFKEKWNEFSYAFGIMVRNIADVAVMLKQKDKVEARKTVNVEEISVVVQKKTNTKKDELDISDFL